MSSRAQKRLFRDPALYAVLALFAACGLAIAAGRPLWRDEAFSALLARRSFGDVIAVAAADFAPPLFYLLLAGWRKAVGEGAVALRLLPLLFSLGTLVLFRAHCRLVADDGFSPRQRDLAFALLALHPVFLHFSVELRSYALLMMLVMASILAMSAALSRHGGWWTALAGVHILLVYTHNLGWVWVAGQGLALAGWLLLRRDRRQLGRLGLVSLGTLAAYAPWLEVTAGQVRSLREDFWLSFHSLRSLLQYRGLLVHGEGGVRFEWVQAGSAALFAGLLLLALVEARKTGGSARLYGAIYAIAAALYYPLSALAAPILHTRYLSLLVPLTVILACSGSARVARRHPAFFPPLMLACLVFSLLSVEGLIRADGRPRYEALSRLSRPVYAAHGFDIMPCLYYAPSCRYVGDVGATPVYIGASHLPGIPAVPGWEGVTGEACYVVYRGEGQSPAPRLRERGYAPGAAPRGLGEDVYRQLYKMGN